MRHVRFMVFTTLTLRNAVFWDIKTQLVLHRRHITSPLQSPASYCYVRFVVFMAVTMKNAVVWDVALCDCCKNRRFGETYPFHHQGDVVHTFLRNVGSYGNTTLSCES
jgi:hypothetical protein